jgi:hypothetical protein
MSDQNDKLPKEIAHYLATLSKTYKYDGSITKLEIIANAQVRTEVGAHTTSETVELTDMPSFYVYPNLSI